MTVLPAALRYGQDMRTASQDDVCEVTCVHPEAVARARATLPDAGCIEDATALLKVVADPTRFRILSALNTEELCVCDLAEVAGISESGASHQLRLLRDRGLVAFRREGQRAVYRLADDHVRALIAAGLEHADEERS